ncbi:tyrosine-type recombinase/integrase [Novosphingobium sp.]|uniref:tyrosine-type recombinase/integrase n=1 Tax=Novosphingobium sp. TaxID=1874826 RepID=UPI003B52C2D2
MQTLEAHGSMQTLDLARVLAATGMRVDGEALSFDGWARRDATQTLHITGKGGHERTVPVTDPVAWSILSDPDRYLPMMKLSYRTHSRNWKRAVEAAQIGSKLPTPHAVRHYYATQAYAKCKDIRVVQDLLGHADYGTTARYIGVDIERMRSAVS